MIRFSLHCDRGHDFDSWFKSNDAYESLDRSGMLSCPVCGSTEIKKSMMTPQLRSNGNDEAEQLPAKAKADLSKPATPSEQALAELRKFVVENSEYVGKRFASEARAIHVGDAPKRSIFGEAKPDDARALVEEGIAVAPLPWAETSKPN